VDKIKAEEIITSAYQTLIEKLHVQDDYSPQVIIDDLHRLAKALQDKKTIPLNLHSEDKNFELEYKNLAKESIDSYAQTKESVERINKEQQRLISESSKKDIEEIDKIMQSFTDVHEQVEAQMRKANETISSLYQEIAILEKTSNLDPLTRTFNRRALDSYLGSLCEIHSKNINAHILLVDIDDFKVVNDAYGHLAGDRVLIFLSKLINSSIRDGDKVFRFGGEEFLILLSRSTELSCQKVAQRLLDGVRSNTLLYKEHHIKITLSIGATALREDDNIESFIERADKALYKAKSIGKDQLVTG
jgi:diguanylate cyclase (GGDEF)-like protein